MHFAVIDITSMPSVLPAIASVLAFLIGFAIGCMICAAFLKRAVSWLRFEPISYWESLRISFLVNTVLTMFSLLIGINYGLIIGLSGEADFDQLGQRMAYSYPPIFFLYQIVLNLIVSAAIFRRFVFKKASTPGQNIDFVDGIAVSSLYFGLTIVFFLAIAVVVGSTIVLAT